MPPSKPLASRVERLAIELRQIDAEDATHGRQCGTRKRNWDGAGDYLKDAYRQQARRLLRVIDSPEVPVDNDNPEEKP